MKAKKVIFGAALALLIASAAACDTNIYRIVLGGYAGGETYKQIIDANQWEYTNVIDDISGDTRTVIINFKRRNVS